MSAEACFRLPCARCGGPVSALEGASTLVCPHCGEAFFLDTDGGAGWLLQPDLRPREAVLPAKRWLREQGVRVTAIGEPIGVLAPLYWVRGLRMVWELRDPVRSAAGLGAWSTETAGARSSLSGSEISSPSDVWEARVSVRATNHTLPAHPLVADWRGGGTRLGSRPLSLLDPDRLPTDYRLLPPDLSVEGATERADSWRSGKLRLQEREVDWHRGAAPLQRRLNLVSVPLVLVPYQFREEAEQAVVVDALSGRGLGTVDANGFAAAAAEQDLPPLTARATERVLIPLDCAECGWKLDPDERDRLYPCVNCGLCWEWQGGERRRVRQWFRDGRPGPGGRWLPFWVFGSGGGESPPPGAVYVPAYEARHLEAQLWLSVRLTRTPPQGPWTDHHRERLRGASHGSDEAGGWLWGVRGALARSNFGNLVKFLKEPPGLDEPVGLAWLPFRREGGDLVETTSGARTRAHGVTPWQRQKAA